jgi:hypothetical protein
MRILISAVFLAITTNAFSQTAPKTAKSSNEFIPSGYVIFNEIRGDLNKDNQEDYVYIIKGTDKKSIVTDKYREQLDRNQRGIMIVIKNKDKYELVLENFNCFSSENEDGGIYYAPDLDVTIEKGNLIVNYTHGRYGYWEYVFRYQHYDFELIGYDRRQSRGPVEESFTSINFLTKKMLVKVNVNQNAEGGDEIYKENWKRFYLSKPIKLRDIASFDNLDVKNLVGLDK